MRIILAVFPDRYEAFSSLSPFFITYPEYEHFRSNINNYLSRKKQPYKNKEFTLIRLGVKKGIHGKVIR